MKKILSLYAYAIAAVVALLVLAPAATATTMSGSAVATAKSSIKGRNRIALDRGVAKITKFVEAKGHAPGAKRGGRLANKPNTNDAVAVAYFVRQGEYCAFAEHDGNSNRAYFYDSRKGVSFYRSYRAVYQGKGICHDILEADRRVSKLRDDLST